MIQKRKGESLDLPKRKPDQGSQSFVVYISKGREGLPPWEIDLVSENSFEKTIP